MSLLSAFCPVKLFGYLVRGEQRNSFVAVVGASVAVASLPGSALLYRLGFKEWAKPTVILGFVGAAATFLGLENARIYAEERIKSENASENYVWNEDIPQDVMKAIVYLSNYYWKFWEEKINYESEVVRQHLVRPNIPSELGYAFGNALLKVLEMKINARYEKICGREGNVHPERWEFRTELRDLDLEERELWIETKNLVEKFRSGPKAFNKRSEDVSLTRPLLYCEVVELLRKFHPKYEKILLDSRAEKKHLLSQQMSEPTVKLPAIPEIFQGQASADAVSDMQNPESSVSEDDDAKLSQNIAAGGFIGTDSEPVVVSQYQHLRLVEEPSRFIDNE